LERFFTAHDGEQRWVDYLPRLVENYNNTVHSSIKMAPNEVTIENEDLVFKRLLKKARKKKSKTPKFSLGDLVRLPQKEFVSRKTWVKGAQSNWSADIFKIVKIYLNKKYFIYSVADSKGNIRPKRYYERQLNLVKKYKSRKK